MADRLPLLISIEHDEILSVQTFHVILMDFVFSIFLLCVWQRNVATEYFFNEETNRHDFQLHHLQFRRGL